MHQIPLEAHLRTTSGKGANRRSRASGRIPAVLYGKGSDTLNLEIDVRELSRVVTSSGHSAAIINLKVAANGGAPQEHLAMITEVQRDVFQKEAYHVDFHKISLTEKVRSTVPIILHGPSYGEKHGGVLEHVRREVDVEALPTDLPEHLTVDVTGLDIGHSLHVRDIKVADGITVLTSADEIVVVVHTTRVVEEAAAPAAPAAEAAAPAAAAPAAETKA